MDIIKAVIPAAGLGTRFLPYTKAIPKEMLPLLNKPAIHYIAEECFNAGLHQLVMVTNKGKQSIADYFDAAHELEEQLQHSNKGYLTADIRKIIRTTQFTYTRQSEPLGLGHAILSARHIFAKEYFSILLPDDIIISDTPGIQQLMRVARQEKASVIAVQEVPIECVSSYGVIGIKKQISPNLFQVSHLVEKPKICDAPSTLAIVGRYVLSSKIFKALDEVGESSATGELQLTDGISRMILHNERVFAYKIQGTRYDVGTPIGWIKTIISLALQHPQYACQLKSFLADIDSVHSPLFNTIRNIEHTRTPQ
jgi:UTP--glucose-1-phosphate uridylyltransferase